MYEKCVAGLKIREKGLSDADPKSRLKRAPDSCTPPSAARNRCPLGTVYSGGWRAPNRKSCF